MPVPTYDKFIEPVLRFLATRPDGAPVRETYEAAAAALGITDTDKQELLPSRAQPVYKNRAGWAHDRLKRAGLSSSPRRGIWQLTKDGITFAAKHSAPLTPQEVEHLAFGFVDVRLKPAKASASDMATLAVEPPLS